MSVNYLEAGTTGVAGEQEFLFPPYSVFTIRKVERDNTLGIHAIELEAAFDNQEEALDIEVAPWPDRGVDISLHSSSALASFSLTLSLILLNTHTLSRTIPHTHERTRILPPQSLFICIIERVESPLPVSLSLFSYFL